MLIEQTIKIDRNEVTIIRKFDSPPKTASTTTRTPPADMFANQNKALTPAEIRSRVQAQAQAQQSLPAGSTTPARRNYRLFAVFPGGNIEELGPGGDLEDLGPGGNLASGLTIVFGPVHVECCRCQSDSPSPANPNS
ncbi:MAG: hypothetical protein IPJ98_29915 [Bryobacterales bacterium]|nr:hypothetical protein [Bryobacterales bacterium]